MFVSTHQRQILHDCQQILGIPELDVYQLFMDEPMHCLRLDISKQLKVLYVREIAFFCANIDGNKECFQCVPKFLVSIKMTGQLSHKGLFKGTLLVDVLETKCFETVDLVSPLIGAIFIRQCSEENIAPFANSCLKYVDIMMFV